MAKGAQGPTEQQKRNERLQYELMKKQLAESQKAMEMPGLEAVPPAPPPPPPPSGSSADAIEAAAAAKRQAKNRTNAGNRTIFAGESAPRTGPTLAAKTMLG